MTIPKTYPVMNGHIVGILRHGNQASQYAAQRIVELEAEVERLQATLDRRNGDRLDCESCGGPVPFAGAVFCSLKCSYAPGGQPFAKGADPGPEEKP